MSTIAKFTTDGGEQVELILKEGIQTFTIQSIGEYMNYVFINRVFTDELAEFGDHCEDFFKFFEDNKGKAYSNFVVSYDDGRPDKIVTLVEPKELVYSYEDEVVTSAGVSENAVKETLSILNI